MGRDVNRTEHGGSMSKSWRDRPKAVVPQGWLRVFVEMGGDLPPNEWAARSGLDDSEVRQALVVAEKIRRQGRAVY